MHRPILPPDAIHPAIQRKIETLHGDLLRQVQAAIGQHAVVVVGMAGNPFVGKARRLLDRAGVSYEYLGYGSYLSQWRLRNALKMWTGWPTFPMVFVRGVLVGGADDLKKLADAGELQLLLAG
jgi:monothiol glutaredoxin